VPSAVGGRVAPNGLPLLQIEPAPHRTAADAWVDVAPPPAFHVGDLATVAADGVRLVLCGLGTDVVAYSDPCPACAASLGTGRLDGERLTCAGCGARFDARHAGAGVDGTTARLTPVPLLPAQASGYRAAVPAPAGVGG
jgi:nitrite reductase/ring-hydroxylating ferredoxin subunit